MKNNEHNNEKTLKINEKCRKNNEQKQWAIMKNMKKQCKIMNINKIIMKNNEKREARVKTMKNNENQWKNNDI